MKNYNVFNIYYDNLTTNESILFIIVFSSLVKFVDNVSALTDGYHLQVVVESVFEVLIVKCNAAHLVSKIMMIKYE